ncbi:glycosyltransferase [Candidatus Competibacter phosphatis]|uniref:Glycosyltransferase n=1 Tax=Candidatus Competibacter phosphatis TaxID=221280 RepID=A0ABX1TRS5_9GAMM|nr:glycosyltransferase [Candidatus Competibacter phosphatis]NMQ20631.1 glycosyltransferase [Candidatus Competibacter phosphatis]
MSSTFATFYADTGLTKTHGIKKLAYQRMKQLEGPMIHNADKVVCLTQKAREVLTGWYLTNIAEAARRFQVIPCCADFAHFDLERVSPSDIDLARKKAGLQPDDCVLLYLGSLGPDYLLPQMLALFRQMLALRSSARFLFVSNNGRELVNAECVAQGISHDRIRFISADRNEIPTYLALADLSVVFIRADISKAGCSPTKLAELFACNVPVIANTGVGDLDAMIDLQRNGSVIVRDFREATLRAAVERVMAQRQAGGINIRENCRELTLEQGVMRYAEVYHELLPSESGIQTLSFIKC